MAEHRVVKHRYGIRLSHTATRTRVIAFACIAALGFAAVPSAATAQTAAESLAATRDAIDATANQWFAAQRKANDLDLQIQTLAQTLAPTERRVDELRRVADARAVELYESNTEGLSTVMGANVITSDPLEVGRRAALIAQANQDDHVVIDELEAAIGDLTARRDALEAARSAQATTLQDLSVQRRTLDAQLASLSRQAAGATDGSRLASSVRSGSEPATTAAPTGSDASSGTSTGPVQTTFQPVATAPTNGAVSPHHNEPFLVCTRARESSGNYGAVSSDGNYYGAYQFLPTTWNTVASHAGRLDLVGLLPSVAAAYDQDELAWNLYLWQGNAPWGGRC